jgi:hypothetical protein
LYADFEKNHQAAAVEFAKQAAGSSNENTVYLSFPRSDASTGSSQSRGSSSSSHSKAYSAENEELETHPSSALSDSDNQLDSVFSDDEPRYVLLCVNSGVHRIDLTHVDLTPKYEHGVLLRKNDQSLMKEVKEEYMKLRGNRAMNIIVIPKMVQFIKVRKSQLRRSSQH